MPNKIMQSVSRVAAGLASVVLIYVAAHTLLEIVLRTAFNLSTAVVVEFAGYGLASMTFLALADTMRAGTLVRVNVVLHVMPPSVRRFLDGFCVLTTLAVTLFVIYFVWIDVQRSFVRGFFTESVVPLPAWLPKTAFAVGLVVFALDLIVHFILVLRGEVELASSSEGI
jgi:TRAP-type C4-dicarboxylate transport system permease small subunit